jgi:RNA polymerase sigma-70 factor (ECF subfamily)
VITRRIVVREMSQRRLVEAVYQGSPSQTAVETRTPEAHRIEDREEVQRLLEDLAETDAEVVRQFHLEGKSYREISHHLGIPENTIGPTLSRARDRMRRRQMQS